MINLTLPDGSIRRYEDGITPFEVVQSIDKKLVNKVISVLVNNCQVELSTSIKKDSIIKFLTWNDDLGKKAFWHSSAHLLAQAILYYYPNSKLTIGPAVEKGFYYDVDFEGESFQEKDFKKIESTMIKNAKKNVEFYIYPVTKQEALEKYKRNIYKTELIQNLSEGIITFCSHDDFTDLCRGGHIPSTGFIKAVKILNSSGAYWKGNNKNKQLTRVYGISFPKIKDLTEYLVLLEEAKKRDHRKIGKKLGFFTFSDKVGAGLPLWLPKGAALRKKLEDFLFEIQKKSGYEMVITPHIGNKELYLTSGHYEKYGVNLFHLIHTSDTNEALILKPMNCPHHCEIYKSFQWSYRDLPKRLAEFGTVYRYEQSGELHGLTRVRGFTQDDAHIFCTSTQLLSELESIIDLVLNTLKVFNFKNFTSQISVRDKNNNKMYIGSDDNWDKAEQAIIQASKNKNLITTLKYREAAFYGPKLDFMVKDALGRIHQLGTIQVDYNLPERFNLEYVGSDGKKHRPVMIHRASIGSIERFIAILIEHTAGNLPIWLSPNPYIILPISEKYNNYAKKIIENLKKYDIFGLIDQSNNKIGKKIRDAELNKFPIMLIVGEEEKKNKTISVRRKDIGDIGKMKVDQFLKYYNSLIKKT